MDASFLIQSKAPAKGMKATDQAAPETAKDDPAQGDASFGEILGKVESGATTTTASQTEHQASEAKTDETAADHPEEASAEGLVVSLDLALAQQILTITPLQTNSKHTDSSASPGDISAKADGELTAIAGSSVESATTTGLTASTALPIGLTPTATTPQGAIDPDESAAEDHLTLTAQATQMSTTPGHEMTGQILDQKPALSLPSTPLAKTGQGGGEGEAVVSSLAGATAQPVSQDSAKETAAAVGVRPLEAPATPAPKAEGEHQAKAAPQPAAKPFAQTAAEDPGAGQSQGESGSQSQQAPAQDKAMAEQTQRLSTAVQEGKPAGQDRKMPTAAESPASERLPVGSGEARAFRPDESMKIAAAAPVVSSAEPTSPSPVQALRLEVERPDLGQVALRVVLADQTVHAKVTTDHLEVRDFLIARQGQLESGLKANGLEMGEFRVDVNQHRHGQPESGWLGSYRDASGQGRQQSGHQQAPQPDVAADRWSGDIEAAAAGRPSRSLSVFA